MSYKIRNTFLDPAKRSLMRRAPKLQFEPIVAGVRLRIRGEMTITNEQFEHNKTNLELYRSWGVVDWDQIPDVDVHTTDTRATLSTAPHVPHVKAHPQPGELTDYQKQVQKDQEAGIAAPPVNYPSETNLVETSNQAPDAPPQHVETSPGEFTSTEVTAPTHHPQSDPNASSSWPEVSDPSRRQKSSSTPPKSKK